MNKSEEFHTGHILVGTTKQVLTTLHFQYARHVELKAAINNAGQIFVGPDTLVSGNGWLLDAGESVQIPIDSLDKIYIVASEADQGLSYLCL